ncbi:hypothetical protein DL96DRAFT_1594416 [Flagelloscypha sp. PMI_526]|nr:hypothetical protein DL96DRAFT_1594416 [Flagelloscypha sp. PMI_526]
MSFLLALVTSLVLVKVPCIGGGRGETVSCHMIGTSTTVTLDGRQGRSIQTTTGRRRSRSETSRSSSAQTSNMAETTAIVTFLSAGLLLNSQTGTFSLDVADTSACVALLLRRVARLRAALTFMARLSRELMTEYRRVAEKGQAQTWLQL